MELREILKKLNTRKKELLILTVSGGILGIIATFIPGKYVAEGYYFIGRVADKPSNEFFTYEGYYAQQTAQSYTNTAIALLESENIKSAVLGDLKLAVTDNNLRKLSRTYKVYKKGPQVVSLAVADYNNEKTLKIYDSLSKRFLEAGEKITNASDENIKVLPISEEPVVKRDQRPLPNYLFSGLLIGLAFSLLKFSFKEYIK
ncbi:MAG: hypothetical protein KatS3mg101_0131 [Patescibacteria group bacterium]|nr:MAG: hypothetical protein KatS3mg101_0131 [Patescibacteria group bacterium]